MSTPSVYRTIVKSSAVYSIGVIAPSVTSLVLLRVYTHHLTPADYAVTDLIETTRHLLSMLVGGRFGEALFYIYANAKDDSERMNTAATAISGAVLIGSFIALVGFVFAQPLSQLVFQSPRWTIYFRLSFLSFGLTVPLETGFGWLRARDLAVSYVVGALMRLALGVVFNITLLVGFNQGIAGVFWGNLFATAVMTIGVTMRCLADTTFMFVRSVFVKMVRFSIPLGLIGIAIFVIHYGDRFFLQRYVSLTQIGIYSIAYKVGMLVSVPQTAFNQYWGSQVYFVIRGEDRLPRFARINTYNMAVLCFTGVLISVFSPAVIQTLTATPFWAAIPLVPGVVLAYVIRGQCDYLRSAFYIEGKPALDARLNWIGASFCLSAYFLLIPPFGLWGGIIATVLTFALLTGLVWQRARKLHPYYLERSRLLKLFGSTGLISLFALLTQPRAPWASWVAGVCWTFAFPITLFISGFFTPAEKQLMTTQFQRLTLWRFR